MPEHELLSTDPDNPTIHLEMARLLIASGEEEAAETHLEKIPISVPEYDTAEQLRQVMSFHRDCRLAGGEAECRKLVEQNYGYGRKYRIGIYSC